jgi:hypothetical protein
MGLDVNLYHFKEPLEAVREREENYLEARDILRARYRKEHGVKDVANLQRDVRREYFAEAEKLEDEYGVDSWGKAKEAYEKVVHDSELYPDHTFKVGYWRSSYHDTAFNTVTRILCGKCLSYVIAGTEELYVQPDWELALERANEFREELTAAIDRTGNVKVKKVSYNNFKDPQREKITSENKALTAFLDEREKVEKTCPELRGYENNVGIFHLDGLKVLGFIEGVEPFRDRKDPVIYVAYEVEPEEGDNSPYDWYLRAMDIVVETIEWVLSQENPQEYVLAWRS